MKLLVFILGGLLLLAILAVALIYVATALHHAVKPDEPTSRADTGWDREQGREAGKSEQERHGGD